MNNNPIPPEQPDYKLAMLAAAEASFAMAARVLIQAIGEAQELMADKMDFDPEDQLAVRLSEGLELLEEAMEIHEKYMKACK